MGNLPSVQHLLPIGFGTDSGELAAASDFGRHHPGTVGDIIRNGGGDYPRNGLGEFLKAEPRDSANAPGLLMSRRGAGGWSAPTLMQIIVSP